VCDLGRVLRLDARRTALLFAVPVLAAVGVAAAWPSLIPGVAYWDNAVIAISTSIRFLGPVAAALAAWVAMRERRLDYLRGLAVRSPATGPLLDLALLTAVALAAYGIVTLVIVSETLLREEAGRLRPLGILAGGTALVLYVVIGYLTGRSVPRPWIVPATALASWLWAALRPESAPWWNLLPPAVLGHVEPFAGLRTAVAAHQLLWSLSLITILVLGYVWAVTRRGLLIVPLATALVVSGISMDRLRSFDGVGTLPSAPGLTCREWPLTVCVHPALRAALPSLAAQVTPLAARLTGTPGAFTRVEQRPPHEPVEVQGGIAHIHLSDLAPGYERRVEEEIQAGLVNDPACRDPLRARGAAYSALVSAWLLDKEPLNPPRTAAARRFARWSEQQRRGWLRAHYTGYHRCELTDDDFRTP
jgi:hypothetical protein